MPHPVESVFQLHPEQYPTCKQTMYDYVLALQARVILETGTFDGDSARIWSSALRETSGHLWTVDSEDVKRKWPVDLSPIPENITFIHSRSVEIQWTQPLDILYLDSDHTQSNVVAELEKFGPLVRPGGKIFLHDTRLSDYGTQIRGAIHLYRECHPWPYSELPDGYGLGILHVGT